VFGRTVACHDLDPGPLLQPCRNRRGRAIRQQVDYALPFQIEHDRAVGPPLAQRPVVHGHDPQRLQLRQRQPPDQAQHRVRAHRHGQMMKQPGTRLAAKHRANSTLSLAQPAGATRMGCHQLRQALGKSAPGAGRIAAVEPPHLQPDADLTPERGQVGRVPAGAAVHGPACTTAIRTAPAGPDSMCSNVEEVRAVQRDSVDAAARHGTKLVHALFYGQRGSRQQTSVSNRHDPRKVRENHGNGAIPSVAKG